MSYRANCILAGVMAGVCLMAGCGPDEAYVRHSNSENNGPDEEVPTSLAGRSYTFTVTANHGFPQGVNSGYTINFLSDTAYLLHPTPQNDRVVQDEQGNYLFSARIGVVHFVEAAPVTGRPFDAALTFLSPTSGSAHLTGHNGETQDVVFFQTSP